MFSFMLLSTLGRLPKKSKEYLRKASDGEFNAYTSVLTWDEVVYVVGKVAGFEESLKVGKILLKMPFLEFLDVNYAICEDHLLQWNVIAQKLAEKIKQFIAELCKWENSLNPTYIEKMRFSTPAESKR